MAICSSCVSVGQPVSVGRDVGGPESLHLFTHLPIKDLLQIPSTKYTTVFSDIMIFFPFWIPFVLVFAMVLSCIQHECKMGADEFLFQQDPSKRKRVKMSWGLAWSGDVPGPGSRDTSVWVQAMGPVLMGSLHWVAGCWRGLSALPATIPHSDTHVATPQPLSASIIQYGAMCTEV